jgi:hypothetical protein
MIVRRRGFLLLTLGVCACSLDTRHLASAGDGLAGALVVGQSYAGTAGASGGTSEAGVGVATGVLVDGCADLDTDGVADCNTTLVSNPSFSGDVSNWIPVGGATLTWDPKNALTDLPSGSAKLRASTARASAFQCVSLGGAQLVVAYANANVESVGNIEPAQAELEVSFYDSEDCSGERSRYFETPPDAVADAWVTIQAGALSRATSRSASIALVGLKAASASELDIYFDNVMLKAKSP